MAGGERGDHRSVWWRKDISSRRSSGAGDGQADVALCRLWAKIPFCSDAETNFYFATIGSLGIRGPSLQVGSLVTPSSLLASLTDVSDMFRLTEINNEGVSGMPTDAVEQYRPAGYNNVWNDRFRPIPIDIKEGMRDRRL